ncbi:MAG: DUF1311 domain-containing protein [Proteobacteria bacterium]|nr:DUF1311 domain-containing protein [Pseudomonadota bacterium]
MKYLLTFCIFFITVIPVYCEEIYSIHYDQCMDSSGGVTYEMQECMNSEFQYQDSKLNEVYKKLMNSLSDDRKKQLRDAQRLWIAYTEKNCDFYDEPDGGSLERLSAISCILSSTANRVRELESFIE